MTNATSQSPVNASLGTSIATHTTSATTTPNKPQQFNKRTQFQARLDNQKQQLERHGNFAEVVIRTTPEGTDMINFARLWEYALVQADRQTRGYVAKSSRNEFEATRKDFEDCLDMMVQKLKAIAQRHHLDLSGTNFISRVAQRYQIADKARKAKSINTNGTALVQSDETASKNAKKPTRVKAEIQIVADEVDA